jgi:hypothetical protein
MSHRIFLQLRKHAVNESIHIHEPVEPPLRRDLDQEPLLGHVPLSREDARRSAKNIARWNSYLPAACVRAMVQMGWDYTT